MKSLLKKRPDGCPLKSCLAGAVFRTIYPNLNDCLSPALSTPYNFALKHDTKTFIVDANRYWVCKQDGKWIKQSFYDDINV